MLSQIEGKYIYTFLKVYEYRNISKASSVLGFSQSSVTNHIQLVEQMAGAKLFQRMIHGVVPTEQGEIFAKYAYRFMKLAQEMNDEIQGIRSTIKVKALESFCVTQFSEPLVGFLEQHPRLEIELTTAFQQHIVDEVLQQKVDVGIVPFHPHIAKLKYTPIVQEKFVFVCSSAIALQELMNNELRVIGFGNHCMYQSLTDKRLAELGKTHYRNITYTSLEMIKQTVLGGAGIALMPESAIKQELDAGRLQTIELGEPIWIEHGVIEHASAKRNANTALFKQYIVDYFEKEGGHVSIY
ncbi:LysR family transcriptional regulator [Paenibacillus hunanensis]|uniref:LysR family transcriptional regulator n=1 Tax=Paenibacillus hunanensis TaxID=539262 RepID=UPI002025DB32|nr:LysR family transcriptional regulator [Paenibacillus hunanensis]MCL9662605.1 LysR family transcriptional regulator [Paenibacillus hunanensis]